MTRPTRLRRLVVGVAVAAAAAASPMAQTAGASSADIDTSRIEPPVGNRAFFAAHAIGVQIYTCTATSTGTAWTLLAPRATLYDEKGKVVATHFAGPTWEARDGSRVVGKRLDGITVDPSAIQWLLIKGDSWSVGADGDRLTATTFVQRLNTTGGLPPAADTCDAEAVGHTAESQYTADYTFWRADHV